MKAARVLWPWLLLLAAALVYGGGLDNPLFFDDSEAIVANESIRELGTALSPPAQTPVAGRPVVNLSFALNYALSGLQPFSYRVLNLLLHVLDALLAWLLLRDLLAREPVPERVRAHAEGCARAISLLWLLHPLGSEAVAYLTQRTELLASTFYLLTLLLGVRALSAERPLPWSVACALACLLGTGCKETIVSAPIVVLMIDRAFFRNEPAGPRRELVLYGGLALSWAALGALLASSPRGATAGLGLGVGVLEHLATQGSIVSWYLRLALWPSPLSIAYDWPLAQPLTRYLLPDLFMLALVGVTLWLAWRRPWAALPGLVFFGVLAPSSSFVPVLGELAAERRMYLPLLAVIVVVVCAGAPLLARSRKLALLLVSGLALASGVATAQRVHTYGSELRLWQDTLSHQPDNPIALWGTGDALARAGRSDEALVMYERMAARPHPYRGPFSWGARGLFAAAQLHARRGERALAHETMIRAFAHDPASPLGTLYRAAVLRKQGDRAQAIALLQQALRQPHLRGANRMMLAQLYAEQEQLDRARATMAAAEQEHSNDREARSLAVQLLSL